MGIYHFPHAAAVKGAFILYLSFFTSSGDSGIYSFQKRRYGVYPLLTRLMDKFGKDKFIYASILLFIAGLVVTGLNDKSLAGFGIGMLITMAGYGCFMILLGATIRDFTPEDKTGMFQGIRMIFMVLLPMVIGPVIGKEICKISAITYTNEYDVVQSAPGAVMFFAAAAVGALIFLPVIFLKKNGLKKN